MSVSLLVLSLVFIVSVEALNAQNPASQGKTPSPSQTPKPARVHVSSKPPPIHRAPPNNLTTTKPDISYAQALGRYQHARHTRYWWKRHFTTFVLVGGGYYYWDAGYWFPAWGFDLNYEAYDYDGPIFTYGNLLPDQVILNVQRTLQDLGYYGGALNGSLGPATRRALSAFQQDSGLEINGIVDGPTVYALGLI
jgi:hypothetical protein